MAALETKYSVLDTRQDDHGKRTTILETKWGAFFGEDGVFKLFCRKVDGHDKKLDKLMWLVAVGVGIIITLEFVLKH